MKKSAVLVCGVLLLPGVIFAADYAWKLSGAETNDWFVVKDGKNGFGKNPDVLPGSDDTVLMPNSGVSSSVKLDGNSEVTVSRLALAAAANSTGSLLVTGGAKLTVQSSATASLSLGARDGGTGTYKSIKSAFGFLTVDGGEVKCPNFAMLIGCSSNVLSRSSVTLNDGVIATKGANVGYWGYGEMSVNGGIYRSVGMTTVGNSYSAAYPARAGVVRLTGGVISNSTAASFKVQPTGRYIQTGGSFIMEKSAGVECGFSNSTNYYGIMELRGGSFICKDIPFGQGNKYGTTAAALRISLYGGMERVSVKGLSGSQAQYGYTNQLPLVEYVMSDGRVTPITIDYPTSTGYSSYSVDTLKKWLRPDGGVQLISTNRFAIFRNNRLHMTGQDINTTYPNRAVWTYGSLGTSGGYNEDGCTLVVDIEVRGALETPVPFGYLELPPVKTNNLKSAYVEMTLVPQGDVSFADLAQEMAAAGHDVEVKGGNTLRVNLPFGRLGDRATDRKFFFDFTRQDIPYHACRGIITTNALVSAVSYTAVNKPGMVIILR